MRIDVETDTLLEPPTLEAREDDLVPALRRRVLLPEREEASEQTVDDLLLLTDAAVVFPSDAAGSEHDAFSATMARRSGTSDAGSTTIADSDEAAWLLTVVAWLLTVVAAEDRVALLLALSAARVAAAFGTPRGTTGTEQLARLA